MYNFCGIHQLNYNGSECPLCLQERQHAELVKIAEQNEVEAAERVSWSDYRRDNPGDYECPHCKYITIKLGATKCPKCQGVLDQKQQDKVAKLAAQKDEVQAKELARYHREAEERRRVQTEKESVWREQAEAAKAAAERRRASTLVFFVFCIICSLLLYFSVESELLSLLAYLFVPLVAWLSYWISNDPYRLNLNRALVASSLVALAIPLLLHARVFSLAIEPLKIRVGIPNTYEFGMLGSPILEIFSVGVVLWGFFYSKYIPPLVILNCAIIFRIIIGFP